MTRVKMGLLVPLYVQITLLLLNSTLYVITAPVAGTDIARGKEKLQSLREVKDIYPTQNSTIPTQVLKEQKLLLEKISRLHHLSATESDMDRKSLVSNRVRNSIQKVTYPVKNIYQSKMDSEEKVLEIRTNDPDINYFDRRSDVKINWIGGKVTEEDVIDEYWSRLMEELGEMIAENSLKPIFNNDKDADNYILRRKYWRNSEDSLQLSKKTDKEPYSKSTDTHYKFLKASKREKPKRRVIDCDLTRITFEMLVSYLRTGRFCSAKALKFRFGAGK